MPLAESNNVHQYQINAYDTGFITISNQKYSQSFILSPEELINWPVTHIDQLNLDLCQSLIKNAPQVVLLGTGETQLFPDPKIYAFFGQQNIGLEVMANDAACRTFNILAAEDRRVVAGFIFS